MKRLIVGEITEYNINTIAEIAQRVSAENNRRQRQSNTIQSLLSERQEVIVAMCDLADLKSKDVGFEAVLETLKSFNQALVDYTALGHFEIYERIIDGKERREKVKRIANRVYPSISSTTEYFVDFNDKYDGADGRDSLVDLYKDLSSIGEAMAVRIESEDQLLRELSV
jgi:regulator of sigma D